MNEILGFQVSWSEMDEQRYYFVVILWEPDGLYPYAHCDVRPTIDGQEFSTEREAKERAQEIYQDVMHP
jgi:hypothetical protein